MCGCRSWRRNCARCSRGRTDRFLLARTERRSVLDALLREAAGELQRRPLVVVMPVGFCAVLRPGLATLLLGLEPPELGPQGERRARVRVTGVAAAHTHRPGYRRGARRRGARGDDSD